MRAKRLVWGQRGTDAEAMSNLSLDDRAATEFVAVIAAADRRAMEGPCYTREDRSVNESNKPKPFQTEPKGIV